MTGNGAALDPLRCRLFGHRMRVTSVDLAGNQSYRMGRCDRHEGSYQQHLTWGGRPSGPWRHFVRVPCTHGVNGANLGFHNCHRCLNEHRERGLR